MADRTGNVVSWREVARRAREARGGESSPVDLDIPVSIPVDPRAVLAGIGVPERLLRAMFAVGQEGPFEPGTHERALELADQVGLGASLYVHGAHGCGKSHVAAAALLAIVEGRVRSGWRPDERLVPRYGAGLVWAEWTELLESLRREVREDATPERLDAAIGAEVLVLDDIGATARVSGFTLDMARLLIAARYNACRQTVFTSNLDPDALADAMRAAGHPAVLVEPIISRMHGIAADGLGVVEVRGRDRRTS